MPSKKPEDDYTAKVDRAVIDQMEKQMDDAEKNKAIANAIRWAAVKGKLVLKEHGAGFLEEDD